MKKTKGFGLTGVIIIMVITALVSSVATGVIMLNNTSTEINGNILDLSADKELMEFIEVYDTLLKKYYDNIDKKGMLNAAEEGMLNFLGDKYTTYLDDNEYSEIMDELSGTYFGIGVTIENNRIIKITSGSPAEKAGLMAEDLIVSVNNNNVEGMDSDKIVELIKNNPEKKVDLEVNRNGEIMSFSIKKTNLINPSITYEKIENTQIGYIYIKAFSQNLSKQVSDALKELEKDGIESLIIDVRDNVGGYLSAAEETASLFLEEGKIIYSLESSNNTFTYKDKTKEKRTYPVVVLTNNISASASEILAAALKESYYANIVGIKTYGKGKVQQMVSLQNGDSVKYTSAKWLTPKGKCIDGVGIEPDYYVEYAKEEKYDTQINKAIELLK